MPAEGWTRRAASLAHRVGGSSGSSGSIARLLAGMHNVLEVRRTRWADARRGLAEEHLHAAANLALVAGKCLPRGLRRLRASDALPFDQRDHGETFPLDLLERMMSVLEHGILQPVLVVLVVSTLEQMVLHPVDASRAFAPRRRDHTERCHGQR
eukprot:1214503-Prymnesium_polylepis.1